MAASFSLPSRPAELLAPVITRLASEFPATPRDEVVRCVHVARDPARVSTSADPASYANSVEVLARTYLVTIESVRSKGTRSAWATA
jgi:hypothetical protein